MDTTSAHPGPRAQHLLVAGAGNNGSSLIPHLARMPGIGEVTIIDRDVYEPGNLGQADIAPGDVGRAKAAVQARRLRRLDPSLRVHAVQADLHDLALGRFRADLILAALDSKEARRVVNEAAWRLRIPWVDSGINAQDGLRLARVTVYVPGPEAPCLECAWSDADYYGLEQPCPCLKGTPQGTPTNAPASLGALAAAMQALEALKLVEGDTAHALCGRQMLVDARNHTSMVSALRRNPQCRFDHGLWRIEDVDRPDEVTLNRILDTAHAQGARPQGRIWIRVHGRPFVRRLQCPVCGATRETLCLLGRMPPRTGTCCSRPLQPVGFEMADRLDLASLPARTLAMPIHRLGLRRYDVFTVGSENGAERHYEIHGDPRKSRIPSRPQVAAQTGTTKVYRGNLGRAKRSPKRAV